MGRAEKRRAERKARIESRKGAPMSRGDIDKLTDDTIASVSNHNVETLMTCFGLAQRRLYGFGYERIMRTLNFVDELMGPIIDGTKTIEDYKKELESETGVIIKCE